MRIAKPLQNLIDSLEKLPGIGPKSAQRLAYYLLHVPQSQLDNFSEALVNLKKDTVLCSVCKNVAENDPCDLCGDENRDGRKILVVEHPLDVLAFERVGKYDGLYHVLHGAINPLDNIGPDEIFIEDLIVRARAVSGKSVQEIIIATNPTMEGEATAMYITRQLKADRGDISGAWPAEPVKVTRLGMGIPTGAALEYADENTLFQAFEGRREMI